jgi:hypothetical protein
MRLAFVCGSLVAVFGLVGGSDMNRFVSTKLYSLQFYGQEVRFN